MQDIIDHTNKWLEDFVVHHNLCPFAKRELLAGSVHYAVFPGSKKQTFLESLFIELQRLDSDDTIETTLFIMPDLSGDFFRYLDYLDLAQLLLEDQGYEGVYQLASFHPEYLFEGVDVDAAENFTNRSPYPMIHLLRESSLERAIKAHPAPEEIPNTNIRLLESLGANYCMEVLRKIMEKN